jgi:hypothetical protein
MTTLQIVLLGMVGGLLPDAIRFFKERHDPQVPAFLKTTKFWISLGVGLGLGGLAAWLLEAATAKDAVIYGFAAPELLTTLAAGVTAPPADRGADRAADRGADRGAESAERSTARPLEELTDWWAR